MKKVGKAFLLTAMSCVVIMGCQDLTEEQDDLIQDLIETGELVATEKKKKKKRYYINKTGKMTTHSSPSFCSNDFFMRLRLKKMQCMTTEIAVSTASLRLADQ